MPGQSSVRNGEARKTGLIEEGACGIVRPGITHCYWLRCRFAPYDDVVFLDAGLRRQEPPVSARDFESTERTAVRG